MSFVAILALYSVGLVVYHLSSGKVVGKGGFVRTRDENPCFYWFAIAIEIVLSAVMIGLVVHHRLSRS